MYFDTHTHVNFSAFKNDAKAVIDRALEGGTWLVNVGTQIDTSRQAVDIAKRYKEGVYAAIGVHPVHTYAQVLDEEESHFTTREETFDESVYEKLLNEKVVAVGECGLDYFRLPANSDNDAIKKIQKENFISQLNFAQKHNLPVIINCRDAYEDLLEVMKAEYTGPAIIHSFTDTWDTAKKFLDQGFHIALNGILAFDKTGKLAEVCKNCPNDRILTETDAPYLTPPPFRGKRNEPSYVQYIVAKIAELKGISLNEAAQMTFNNACKFFNLNVRS